ncbi:HEPN domain-containing protein [Fundidesulfovibrio magnetotacticus]|uniref:HEPN domain-containing protein n=1 Tax=Fundidesulfovibrio magnetotacticus TaxID=2730080 RepID=UPI001566B92D
MTCSSELKSIQTKIKTLGAFDSSTPHLTMYALIRSCGTIEASIKTIVADYFSRNQSARLKRFIDKKIRNSPTNPRYDHILKLLGEFDTTWKDSIKLRINTHKKRDKILSSLDSLCNARNDLAHGGRPNVTIKDIVKYYSNCTLIVKGVDALIV